MHSGTTFADVYNQRKIDLRNSSSRSKSRSSIFHTPRSNSDSFNLNKFYKSLEAFSETLNYDPRHTCYSKMKQILAQLPQPYYNDKFTGWVDYRDMDLLQLSIIFNKPDVIRIVLENNPGLFPDNHTPRINPYAHIAATLGYTKCLEILLTHRPAFYFVTSKPQHAIRFHPDIQKRLRITDTGCTRSTNKHSNKLIKAVHTEVIQSNETSEQVHDAENALENEMKSIQSQLKTPKSPSTHRRHSAVNNFLSEFNPRKSVPRASVHNGTSLQAQVNVKGEYLSNVRKKGEHVITVFKDIFSNEPEGVVRGAGPAVVVLSPSDVAEARMNQLPVIPSIGKLSQISRRNRLMKARDVEEQQNEKPKSYIGSKTFSARDDINLSNCFFSQTHDSSLNDNCEFATNKGISANKKSTFSIFKNPKRCNSPEKYFKIPSRIIPRMNRPRSDEDFVSPSTKAHRRHRHVPPSEISGISNRTFPGGNFQSNTTVTNGDNFVSSEGFNISCRAVRTKHRSASVDASHFHNKTVQRRHNSMLTTDSEFLNTTYHMKDLSPSNHDSNFHNNSIFRRGRSPTDGCSRLTSCPDSRIHTLLTCKDFNDSNCTIGRRQSSLLHRKSYGVLKRHQSPSPECAIDIDDVRWIDQSRLAWEVFKPFTDSNSQGRTTTLSPKDSSDNKSVAMKQSRRIEFGVRTISTYKEFRPVIQSRRVSFHTDRYLHKTPLTLAALNGHLATVKYILKTFIQRSDVTQDILTLATLVDSPESLAVLMTCKYSRDDHQSAILVALREFHRECLTVLLQVDVKERHQLFDGENLFHIFFSQSLNVDFRYEEMPAMTRALIKCKEDVNSRNVNSAHPIYTLISCAFHIEAGKQCLYYLDCLRILLAAKANPHCNEMKEDAHAPKRRVLNLKRQLFHSAIHCIFISANRSTVFLQNPYWSRAIMRKFVQCIVVNDKTHRRILNDVLFCYMENVCQVGLDLKILRSLLGYGANPDFKFKEKYAINTFFDNMLPFLTRFEVKTNVDVVMDALICICQAMSCDCLHEAFNIFLDEHLLQTPLQGLALTRQFCYEVNKDIRTPRPLLRLVRQSLWKNLQRSLPNVRRLPLNTQLQALIVPY